MKHLLPKLPYAQNALRPHISAETIKFHYGKHHATYVKKLNEYIKGTEFENMDLVDIIKNSTDEKIFNNAAQVWNHTFYWNCLSPKGGGTPKGKAKEIIDRTFGSFKRFKEEFTESATNLFGSGWTWLVKNEQDVFEILCTKNAGNPLSKGMTPVMAIDVWEHAYYIDYRNAKPNYIKAYWKLVNWDFVSKNC